MFLLLLQKALTLTSWKWFSKETLGYNLVPRARFSGFWGGGLHLQSQEKRPGDEVVLVIKKPQVILQGNTQESER